MVFSSKDIVTIPILSIHEHRVFSTFSLYHVESPTSMSFSFQNPVPPLKLIPSYLILFWCNCKQDRFAFSLQQFSISIQNALYFRISSLYPATLLISSNSFLTVSLRFSMCSIIWSANSDSFTFSFPIWKEFQQFSYMFGRCLKVSKRSQCPLNHCFFPCVPRWATLCTGLSGVSFLLQTTVSEVDPSFLFNWKIIALQCFVGFCCATVWIAVSRHTSPPPSPLGSW